MMKSWLEWKTTKNLPQSEMILHCKKILNKYTTWIGNISCNSQKSNNNMKSLLIYSNRGRKSHPCCTQDAIVNQRQWWNDANGVSVSLSGSFIFSFFSSSFVRSNSSVSYGLCLNQIRKECILVGTFWSNNNQIWIILLLIIKYLPSNSIHDNWDRKSSKYHQ